MSLGAKEDLEVAVAETATSRLMRSTRMANTITTTMSTRKIAAIGRACSTESRKEMLKQNWAIPSRAATSASGIV